MMHGQRNVKFCKEYGLLTKQFVFIILPQNFDLQGMREELLFAALQ